MHSAERLHAASHRPACHLSQQRIHQVQSRQVFRKVYPPSNSHCEPPNSDQSIRQDTQCRPSFQRMNGTYLLIPASSTPPALTLPTIYSVQAQSTAPMMLHLPTLPTWDRMMHSISMMHQSVKHSLGHGEALKHCHGLTAVHIGGSGIRSPSLDPSYNVQVSTQHHCQHAAQPPFQPQPRCRSSASSFCNTAVQHQLMSPGYNKTPDPDPNPNHNNPHFSYRPFSSNLL